MVATASGRRGASCRQRGSNNAVIVIAATAGAGTRIGGSPRRNPRGLRRPSSRSSSKQQQQQQQQQQPAAAAAAVAAAAVAAVRCGAVRWRAGAVAGAAGPRRSSVARRHAASGAVDAQRAPAAQASQASQPGRAGTSRGRGSPAVHGRGRGLSRCAARPSRRRVRVVSGPS